jgi:hypothetical protein
VVVMADEVEEALVYEPSAPVMLCCGRAPADCTCTEEYRMQVVKRLVGDPSGWE